MNKYIVKQSDLTGKIEDFPIEVVQKMVDYQTEQGCPTDITRFQLEAAAGRELKGFSWSHTSEKIHFWNSVINLKRFNLFFERYPKMNKNVYYRGDIRRGGEIIKSLINLGGVQTTSVKGDDPNGLYFIDKNGNISRYKDDLNCAWLLKQAFTEAHLPELPKETIIIGNDTYEITEELKQALSNLKKINK